MYPLGGISCQHIIKMLLQAPNPADGNMSGDEGSSLQCLKGTFHCLASEEETCVVLKACQLWPLNLSNKWNQIIYLVCRFETSNTAEESSGPRLLKLPTVNSVHKQVENNYLRVFPSLPPKFIYDCEKHLYKVTAYIGVRIKWSPQTMHS